MKNIGIIGLGYVGINLAHLFSKGEKVIGFDIDAEKIRKYTQGIDTTGEIGEEINQLGIEFTSNPQDIDKMEYIIIAVPTPSINGKPDTSIVVAATELVLQYCAEHTILIYSSTVYPGFTTREILPIIEQSKKFKIGENIDVAYVPERISPGDNVKIEMMTKIISATTEHGLERVSTLFSLYFNKVFSVSSIEIAEAAKVLENTQRDVNIALLNEFRMIYEDIAFEEVIEAMNTKWNALKFHSGLVGGHCIAEDPYYLEYGASLLGKEYTIVKAARNLNDSFFEYFVDLAESKIPINSKIAILGITYKPNVPDIRKSQVMRIAKTLQTNGYNVELIDPVFENHFEGETLDGIDFKPYADMDLREYDAIILGVSHDKIEDKMVEQLFQDETIFIDIMGTHTKKYRKRPKYYV